MALVPTYGPFVVGTDFTIDFNVVDEDGDAYDLTGATIVALVETLFGSDKSMSIVNSPGTDGICRMVVSNTESNVAHGHYDGMVKITQAGVIRKGKFRIVLEDTL